MVCRGFSRSAGLAAAIGALVLGVLPMSAGADIVHNDDVIITFSLCVGNDCVNGESFGFDTVRLKENNIRVHFDDTSNSASFPRNDWRLVANDSSNGGLSHFSVDDVTGGRTPFRIEAGAQTASLYVDSSGNVGGNVGFGTSSPVVDLHAVSGNTPTLRLEQNGASGFTPQTWDVAGNEAGFFIRDVTGGSQLSLRIRPGAPSSAIDIASDGDVGIGSSSPGTLTSGTGAAVHIRRTDGESSLLIEEASGTVAQRDMLEMRNNGAPQVRYVDSSTGKEWRFGLNTLGEFVINDMADPTPAELKVTPSGDLFVNGGGPLAVPDYVFEPDYELPTLTELAEFIAENKHLPNVQSAADVARDGLNLTKMNLSLLEKVEELTLYTLAQHAAIQKLEARIEQMAAEKSKP